MFVIEVEANQATQANTSAYTVACLESKFDSTFDFDSVRLRQSISLELEKMIEGWTVTIDRDLRRTAKARLPASWRGAKSQSLRFTASRPSNSAN